MDANTERKLSKWGFRVYMAVAGLILLYFFWGMATNTGLAAWLNHVQAQMSGDRRYSPVLTMVLLLIPAQLVAFPAGFLYDYLTDQGIFAPAPQNPPEP